MIQAIRPDRTSCVGGPKGSECYLEGPVGGLSLTLIGCVAFGLHRLRVARASVAL